MTPFQFDMMLQEPVFYMMNRGIRADLEKRRELSEEAHAAWDKNQKMLNIIAGSPINVSSNKQMKALLYTELGLPVRRRKRSDGKTTITADEDALRSLMALADDKRRSSKRKETVEKWTRSFLACRLTLNIREQRKLIESYLDVPLDDDQRARCTMTVGGAETMRFSHSKTLWDTGMNLATIPHKLRTFFIADEGKTLGEFDLNRGESWVYTFLSLDPELLRIHSGGLDFHAETAAIIQSAFGSSSLTPQEVRSLAKSGDPFGYKIRYLGKKVNHASAYRMGPFRAAEVINQESDDTGITVVPRQMKVAQKLWLQKYTGIQDWWWDIDEKIQSERTLWTPYGRKREFFGFINDHLLKEATAVVPQSTSVDYLNHGMLRVYKELVEKKAYGLELLHQNHDSILVQFDEGREKEVEGEVTERLLSTIVINGHEVTIPVEGTFGKNWGDYHVERNPEGLREAA